LGKKKREWEEFVRLHGGALDLFVMARTGFQMRVLDAKDYKDFIDVVLRVYAKTGVAPAVVEFFKKIAEADIALRESEGES